MNIKFVVFYDLDEYASENRNNPLSSRNVVDYITECLAELGNQIEIISPAETKKHGQYYRARSTKTVSDVKVTLGPTKCSANKYLNLLYKLFTRIWFICYMLTHTKKEDVLFLWHQIPLIKSMTIFLKLCPWKNTRVWCVGELYQKVLLNKLSDKRKREEISFIESGDKYILSTSGIGKYVNIDEKESIILPGSLRVAADSKSEKFDDGKIHIVYSGVLNEHKGVNQVMELPKYLTAEYHIHLMGWSAEECFIEQMKKKVKEINRLNKAQISYDGILLGREYDAFLKKCHIGLCLQNTDNEYNDCSFPSKILAYFGAGLRVICSDVSAVKESEIAHLIYFCGTNDPKRVADTVKMIPKEKSSDEVDALKRLSTKFKKELEELLCTEKSSKRNQQD